MRIGFSCGPSGFQIDGSGLFSRFAIRVVIDGIEVHLRNCPYCRFKILAQTNREAEKSIR